MSPNTNKYIRILWYIINLHATRSRCKLMIVHTWRVSYIIFAWMHLDASVSATLVRTTALDIPSVASTFAKHVIGDSPRTSKNQRKCVAITKAKTCLARLDRNGMIENCDCVANKSTWIWLVFQHVWETLLLEMLPIRILTTKNRANMKSMCLGPTRNTNIQNRSGTCLVVNGFGACFGRFSHDQHNSRPEISFAK